MSRMMLCAAASLLLAGCVGVPCGGMGVPLAGRGCDDCIPPWVPYFGHYKQRMDDCVTNHTARHCAWRALRNYRCGGPVSCDFADGFVQAYIDLAENRTPQPPSVAPPKYWSAYYRSCAGRRHVDDWFAGYQVGWEQGSQSGVSRFNQIDVRTCGGQTTGGY